MTEAQAAALVLIGTAVFYVGQRVTIALTSVWRRSR